MALNMICERSIITAIITIIIYCSCCRAMYSWYRVWHKWVAGTWVWVIKLLITSQWITTKSWISTKNCTWHELCHHWYHESNSWVEEWLLLCPSVANSTEDWLRTVLLILLLDSDISWLTCLSSVDLTSLSLDAACLITLCTCIRKH
jgi:hypothetical protein